MHAHKRSSSMPWTSSNCSLTYWTEEVLSKPSIYHIKESTHTNNHFCPLCFFQQTDHFLTEKELGTFQTILKYFLLHFMIGDTLAVYLFCLLILAMLRVFVSCPLFCSCQLCSFEYHYFVLWLLFSPTIVYTSVYVLFSIAL